MPIAQAAPQNKRPISAKIVLVANVVTLVLSFVVIGEGIWIRERHHYDCSINLQWLVLSIGIVMLAVSFLGWFAAKRQSIGLFWLYIVLLSIIILLLIVVTILAFLLEIHGFSTFLHMPPTFLRPDDCNQELLFKFNRDWSTIATTSLIVLVILLVLFSLACSSFMHSVNRHVFGT
ncbi:hypothetical protein KP509_15G058800 [Ceratopteris richardii]|uniref:Uncharacterized protein n=1 Tax=Ceratopteris richardii TaxID=49495 RepID=A0A8T2T513_CERRI|nr:hypothetical protein KP509_15G058800 [Ceratopteris richardii]